MQRVAPIHKSYIKSISHTLEKEKSNKKKSPNIRDKLKDKLKDKSSITYYKYSKKGYYTNKYRSTNLNLNFILVRVQQTGKGPALQSAQGL